MTILSGGRASSCWRLGYIEATIWSAACSIACTITQRPKKLNNDRRFLVQLFPAAIAAKLLDGLASNLPAGLLISSVLDPIKYVGPAINGLAAGEMGLQHGPGALTHGGERLGVVR